MLRKVIWTLFTLLFFLSPFFGAVEISLQNILDAHSLDAEIFYALRLPRLFFAFFAGSILALSGLLFQTLFRNALMTPYTLGISSGATLGVGIAIKLGLTTLFFGIGAITLFGFLGAFLTLVLLLYLSQFLRANQNESLLLLGIALSLFYSAALMLLFYLGTAIQNDMLIRFTMGSLSIIGWQAPLLLSSMALLLFSTLYLYRFELQLLSISHDAATLKGVDTKRVTLILLAAASLSIGVLVGISGPIGFIGLIIPHIILKLYPVTVEKRLTQTALLGGFFLVFCDMISRIIQTESELPIGIVTAFIGAPFFIYLIIHSKRR